ncbi:MAG TPA: hypothetical protein VK929_10055 [Longimicrobiales bacterium]|nr:hypothetical protein [Longimicrobiales bacterium]
MMLLLEFGLFFFVLLGSKILLAAVVIYLLLPQDPRCVICDADMLPIRAPRSAARVLRLLRLQRRWCMECRRETLARQRVLRPRRLDVAGPVVETRVR